MTLTQTISTRGFFLSSTFSKEGTNLLEGGGDISTSSCEIPCEISANSSKRSSVTSVLNARAGPQLVDKQGDRILRGLCSEHDDHGAWRCLYLLWNKVLAPLETLQFYQSLLCHCKLSSQVGSNRPRTSWHVHTPRKDGCYCSTWLHTKNNLTPYTGHQREKSRKWPTSFEKLRKWCFPWTWPIPPSRLCTFPTLMLDSSQVSVLGELQGITSRKYFWKF